jgi:hypothetical protein
VNRETLTDKLMRGSIPLVTSTQPITRGLEKDIHAQALQQQVKIVEIYVVSFFTKYDLDHDGKVTYEEYQRVWDRDRKEQETTSTLKEEFTKASETHKKARADSTTKSLKVEELRKELKKAEKDAVEAQQKAQKLYEDVQRIEVKIRDAVKVEPPESAFDSIKNFWLRR